MGSHQQFPGNCYKRTTNIRLQCYQLYNKGLPQNYENIFEEVVDSVIGKGR